MKIFLKHFYATRQDCVAGLCFFPPWCNVSDDHVSSCVSKGGAPACWEGWSSKAGHYLMSPSQSPGVCDCQNSVILLLCISLTPWILSRNFMLLNKSGEC